MSKSGSSREQSSYFLMDFHSQLPKGKKKKKRKAVVIIKMQADLVIFSFKNLFCSSVCISLSVSTAWRRWRRRRVLIHQDTLLFGWEQGSLLTWFPRSLSSRLRSRTRLRLLSRRPPPKKKLCELDWRSHNLDWLQDIFGKCHSGGFARVNLGESIYKKRLRFLFFSAFSVTITQCVSFLSPPLPSSPSSFCRLCWQVRKQTQRDCQSLTRCHTSHCFLSDSVTMHGYMLGDLSLLFWRGMGVGGGGWGASCWHKCLCRHCIFMSVLLSCAAVGCLTFTFIAIIRLRKQRILILSDTRQLPSTRHQRAVKKRMRVGARRSSQDALKWSVYNRLYCWIWYIFGRCFSSFLPDVSLTSHGQSEFCMT